LLAFVRPQNIRELQHFNLHTRGMLSQLPCKAHALSLAVIVVVEAVKNKFELLDFRLDMT
jgi:hypothetical protein